MKEEGNILQLILNFEIDGCRKKRFKTMWNQLKSGEITGSGVPLSPKTSNAPEAHLNDSKICKTRSCDHRDWQEQRQMKIGVLKLRNE